MRSAWIPQITRKTRSVSGRRHLRRLPSLALACAPRATGRRVRGQRWGGAGAGGTGNDAGGARWRVFSGKQLVPNRNKLIRCSIIFYIMLFSNLQLGDYKDVVDPNQPWIQYIDVYWTTGVCHGLSENWVSPNPVFHDVFFPTKTVILGFTPFLDTNLEQLNYSPSPQHHVQSWWCDIIQYSIIW